MFLDHAVLYPVACVMVLAGAGLANLSRPAQAGDLRMTVEKPHFTCEGSGMLLSHVAYNHGRQAPAGPVLPCCDGRLGCAQFLSTNTVLHQMRQWHG